MCPYEISTKFQGISYEVPLTTRLYQIFTAYRGRVKRREGRRGERRRGEGRRERGEGGGDMRGSLQFFNCKLAGVQCRAWGLGRVCCVDRRTRRGLGRRARRCTAGDSVGIWSATRSAYSRGLGGVLVGEPVGDPVGEQSGARSAHSRGIGRRARSSHPGPADEHVLSVGF